MKVVSALKKYCEHCRLIKRFKKVYIKCPKDPRHKQRQGFCTLEKEFEFNEEQFKLQNFDEQQILKMKIDNMIKLL